MLNMTNILLKILLFPFIISKIIIYQIPLYIFKFLFVKIPSKFLNLFLSLLLLGGIIGILIYIFWWPSSECQP